MNYQSFVVFLVILAVAWSEPSKKSKPDVEDNEFAEFEEFDEADDVRPGKHLPDKKPESVKKAEPAAESKPTSTQAGTEEEEASVENEDDEFEHLHDEEEFEGFEGKGVPKGGKGEKIPDLKITSVPLHLRTNWDSFYLEMLMLAGLGVYFLNFLAGKAKNQKLAQSWLNAHRALLEENFTIVGDDGINTEVQSGVLMKESENIYSLWCSGRASVEGMLIELKLLKRQDLVNTIARLFRPATDQIIVKVTMDEADMDSFVFALGTKKSCAKLQKDMNDLNLFCPDKKSAEKYGLPTNYQILSEIGEASATLVDSKIIAVINKFEGVVEYLHFSDQFSGPKNQDDSQPTKMPETQKVLHFCFNVPKRGNATPKDMEALRPLMQMVFHCIDKVKKIRLSKEAKNKADKNRQKVAETFLKASHSQRQEAAQQRREDKRRAEKEKMMNEEDPDKQRKMEERDQRREMKKKQPKVKMMKMKAA